MLLKMKLIKMLLTLLLIIPLLGILAINTTLLYKELYIVLIKNIAPINNRIKPNMKIITLLIIRLLLGRVFMFIFKITLLYILELPIYTFFLALI